MMQQQECHRFTAAFDSSHQGINSPIIQAVIRERLAKLLPVCHGNLPQNIEVGQRRCFEEGQMVLPIFRYETDPQFPAQMTFFCLARYRPNSFKFFFEMVSRWLVPGKRLNVLLIYAVDLHIPELGTDKYTFCEIVVEVASEADRQKVFNNLPIIQTEVQLGMQSAYYARRILEIKGLSVDEKTAQIQESIVRLQQRLPDDFDNDIYSELQHVLVLCSDKYKGARTPQHLSRMISFQYLFRKELRSQLETYPQKRHLKLKLFSSTIRKNEHEKRVLSIVVAANFLREKEVFEKKHLLKAVQNFIPNARAIENSFLSLKRGNEPICTLYLEVEKSDAAHFTTAEIKMLRKDLPNDLKGRIEHLMHPVFMPRNEEEIMRNILLLGGQIRYLKDLPQVFISFDEQTHSHLSFTVIVVRVMKPAADSIQDLFKQKDTRLNYIHDRCKTLGYLRKKYVKEATVFNVNLPAEEFLRKDHSINLYKARAVVAQELAEVIGQYRDFNGGLISKQTEALSNLRKMLGDRVKYNDLLLENFFYSLQPVALRTVIDTPSIKVLFEMQVKALEEGALKDQMDCFQVRSDEENVYVMITGAMALAGRVDIEALAQKMDQSGRDLLLSQLSVYDVPYLGILYRCPDKEQQKEFTQSINEIIQAHHGDLLAV